MKPNNPTILQIDVRLSMWARPCLGLRCVSSITGGHVQSSQLRIMKLWVSRDGSRSVPRSCARRAPQIGTQTQKLQSSQFESPAKDLRRHRSCTGIQPII